MGPTCQWAPLLPPLYPIPSLPPWKSHGSRRSGGAGSRRAAEWVTARATTAQPKRRRRRRAQESTVGADLHNGSLCPPLPPRTHRHRLRHLQRPQWRGSRWEAGAHPLSPTARTLSRSESSSEDGECGGEGRDGDGEGRVLLLELVVVVFGGYDRKQGSGACPRCSFSRRCSPARHSPARRSTQLAVATQSPAPSHAERLVFCRRERRLRGGVGRMACEPHGPHHFFSCVTNMWALRVVLFLKIELTCKRHSNAT